jgi:hypothetical protein
MLTPFQTALSCQSFDDLAPGIVKSAGMAAAGIAEPDQ